MQGPTKTIGSRLTGQYSFIIYKFGLFALLYYVELECIIEKLCSFLSTKTYVVGTQN